MTDNTPPKRIFPTSKVDAAAAKHVPSSPQTESAAYKLAFQDNDFLLREDLRALGTDLRTDGAAARTVVDRAAVAAERIEEFLRAVSPDGRSISTRAAS